MSVLLSTSVGDLVIDLFTEECPRACENFLKLCAIKYYHQCLIYNVQANYIVQMGDPTGTGRGGTSIYGLVHGPQARFFPDELSKHRKVNKVGYVGMAHIGDHPDTNHSQFFITLRGEDMEHLGVKHTIFGEIAEGFDILSKINGLFCDEDCRPYQDVRIVHTYILDDPFENEMEEFEQGGRGGGDSSLLAKAISKLIPPDSPIREYPPEESIKRRIPYQENFGMDGKGLDGRNSDEIEEEIRRKEAKARAIVLEMTGDIPDADVKPPAEVLFVCKLNPVTRDEDLELIFSRFGPIKSCEIIRDHKTGDSLNYAFIEFETEGACIAAYDKMNNALIDDRRIKVDFSQSVSKLWNRFLLKPRTTATTVAGGNKELVAKSKARIAGDPRDAKHFGVNESKEDERHEKKSRFGAKEEDYHRDRKREKDRDGDRGSDMHRDHDGEKYRSRDDQMRGKDVEKSRKREDSRERTRDLKYERDYYRDDREKDRKEYKDSHRNRSRERENKERDREKYSRDSRDREKGTGRERERERDRENTRTRDRSESRSEKRRRDNSRERDEKDKDRDRKRDRYVHSESEDDERYRRDKEKKSKKDRDRR
jgi:peptidyl-prolyl cis-trans isomerase-like 4